MKTMTILTLMLLPFFYGFSQETFNYKNISVSFPARYKNRELNGINAFYVNKDSVSYQVMIIQDTAKTLKNSNELEAYLEGMSGSFLQNAGVDFKNKMVDTAIGGAKGRYIHVYEPTQHHAFKEAWTFFTVLLNHPYALQVMRYGTIDETSMRKIEDFFNNVKFEGKQFDSQKND